jgi:putative mannosyl-glycoprotein endo-beta-N-acetylglucosaminidase
MALILAAVMAVSCLTTILLAASKPWTGVGIGELSQYYETGNNADPGRVSNVKGDSGGTSYGLYMFVEGTVTNFINWLKQQPKDSTYYAFGDTLWRAYNFDVNGNENPGYGTNFKTVWQSIGHGKNSNEFGQAQTEFWGSTQYTQLVSNIERLFSGFDIDNYSVALKNVFWSRSVHHGVGVTYGANSNDKMSGATGVIARAFRSLGGFKNQSEAELIAAIYAECSRLDPVGKYKKDNMDTYTAQKYGVYGRSMAYFNVNSGGVQTSVYSRLHVNEPSDALVMRYVNSTPDIAEGKYTLLYINNNEQTHGLDPSQSTLVTADKAVKLQITYYSGEKYTIATKDGSQRLTISGGKPVLASPAADNNQFWVIYGSTSSGYTLQNVGTKQYVTVTVTSKEVTEDGSDVLTRDERVAAMITAVDEDTLDETTQARFEELTTAEVTALTEEHLKDKSEDEIKADLDKLEAAEKAMYDFIVSLPEDEDKITEEHQKQYSELENAYLESIKNFTGKTLDEIIDIVAGKLVDEQMAAEAEAPKPSTTVTTYTVGLTDESAKAARWSLNKLGGTDDWTLTGLFYPGCDDSDAIGGTVTHHLTDGNSSFPLRGVISCTKSISSVTVEVKGTSGEPGFTVTGSGKGNWFDLWELDKSATFSSLKQGTYKLTIYGRNASGEVSIWSDSFTVGAKDSSAPAVKDDTYTVTFKNGSNTVTRTYKLGDTYGTLPTASGEGFQGWFTDDGEQIFENSIVAAEDHTITAKFGTLYTVTFKVDGSVYRSRQLAKDSPIVAPSNPFKSADSSYVYSFSHWVDGSGNRFVEGRTYMPAGDVTYTAVFTKTANSGGGTGGSTGGNTGTNTPTPSGNYLTGVSPSTSVSAMNSAGYTIYNGSAKVTSGLVGTGMTAVSSSATVTIVVTGDVSGDGKITITDVVKLQKSVVGSGSLSGAYAKAADINGDGKVTITDVVQAAQVTVGQRTIG